MALYILEDEFEFVTDCESRLVATRYPEQRYEFLPDLDEVIFYICGSIKDPELLSLHHALHSRDTFSFIPQRGEYLVKVGNGVPLIARDSKIADSVLYFVLDSPVRRKHF